MGGVYRARDTRLRRDVAIKILPEAFALDAADDRLLAVVPVGEGNRDQSDLARIEVVLNWFAELKQRVPGGK